MHAIYRFLIALAVVFVGALGISAERHVDVMDMLSPVRIVLLVIVAAIIFWALSPPQQSEKKNGNK